MRAVNLLDYQNAHYSRLTIKTKSTCGKTSTFNRFQRGVAQRQAQMPRCQAPVGPARPIPRWVAGWQCRAGGAGPVPRGDCSPSSCSASGLSQRGAIVCTGGVRYTTRTVWGRHTSDLDDSHSGACRCPLPPGASFWLSASCCSVQPAPRPHTCRRPRRHPLPRRRLHKLARAQPLPRRRGRSCGCRPRPPPRRRPRLRPIPHPPRPLASSSSPMPMDSSGALMDPLSRG